MSQTSPGEVGIILVIILLKDEFKLTEDKYEVE